MFIYFFKFLVAEVERHIMMSVNVLNHSHFDIIYLQY